MENREREDKDFFLNMAAVKQYSWLPADIYVTNAFLKENLNKEKCTPENNCWEKQTVSEKQDWISASSRSAAFVLIYNSQD